MCEPNHSIVQFPPEDDQGNSTESRLQWGLKQTMKWGKRILDWFHFSKMGAGHSESFELAGITSADHYRLPEHTRYEARWWDRRVELDGPFSGLEFDRARGLEAATKYADAVSIGSLSALRQFLETSIRNTDRPQQYVDVFLREMVKPERRDHVGHKLKNALGAKHLATALYEIRRGHLPPKEMLDRLVKVLLGVTRKRDWLVAAWADDGKLWTPGQ